MPADLKIFSGSANRHLAESICQSLGIGLSRLTVSRFSNDNLFVQIRENVREKDVFVVQPFSAPVGDNVLELFIILDPFCLSVELVPFRISSRIINNSSPSYRRSSNSFNRLSSA